MMKNENLLKAYKIDEANKRAFFSPDERAAAKRVAYQKPGWVIIIEERECDVGWLAPRCRWVCSSNGRTVDRLPNAK